jgi:hypothetical protein
MKRTLFAALLLTFAGAAAAQPYVWGGMGSAKTELRTTPDLSGRESVSFELGAGYRFHRYIGLEAGYFKLPQHQSTSPSLNAFWSAKGFTVAAVGFLPISESWTLVGKAGVLRAEGEFKTVTLPAGTLTITETKYGSRPLFGAGVQWAMDPHFSLRAMYQHVEGEDGSELDSVQTLFLGMVIQF